MEAKEASIRVTYADTDSMGVVYYSNYFRWFEIGRTEYFRKLGFSYREMEDKGCYLPVTQAFCKFLKPAKYDDEILIKTSISFLKRASIRFDYKILRKGSEAELATGFTVHAFIDKDGKIRRVPEFFEEILRRK